MGQTGDKNWNWGVRKWQRVLEMGGGELKILNRLGKDEKRKGIFQGGKIREDNSEGMWGRPSIAIGGEVQWGQNWDY